MTGNKLEKYRLTDEEMAEVQGDKEACLAIIHGWGSCSGCSANCRAVAGAQYNKLLPLLKEVKREERERIVSIVKDYFNLSFGEFQMKYGVVKGKLPGDEILVIMQVLPV